ncbi:MAG: VPLPA-CTERM sorting domain-containing protein [Pikeienuella sp.]
MRFLSFFMTAALLSFGLTIPHAAEARPVTISFDHYRDGIAYRVNDLDRCGKVDNVGYCDDGKYLYDNVSPDILIGDHDWAAEIVFEADPKTYFTPRRFDVLSAFSNVHRVSSDCSLFAGSCTDQEVDAEAFMDLYQRDSSLFEPIDYDFASITGYRDGVEIASTSLGPKDGDVFEFGPEFSALDRLVIGVDPAYGNTAVYSRTGGYFYGCTGGGGSISPVCNEMRLDNLAIESRVASPSPVPLPASVWLLGGALGGLGGWRRFSRRAGAA